MKALKSQRNALNKFLIICIKKEIKKYCTIRSLWIIPLMKYSQ